MYHCFTSNSYLTKQSLIFQIPPHGNEYKPTSHFINKFHIFHIPPYGNEH